MFYENFATLELEFEVQFFFGTGVLIIFVLVGVDEVHKRNLRSPHHLAVRLRLHSTTVILLQDSRGRLHIQVRLMILVAWNDGVAVRCL